MSIFTNVFEKLKKSPLVSREKFGELIGKELPKPEEPKAPSETLQRGTKIFKEIVEVPKAILRAPARWGGRIGLTLTGKDELLIDEGASRLEKAIKTILFGKAPLKSLEMTIAEAEIGLPKGEILPAGIKAPSALAIPGMILGIALDFSGFGGKSNIIKVLTKTNKVDDVVKILKGTGMADDLIKSYASILAKTTKIDEVGKIVNRLEELQKTTKVAETGVKAIPKELEPLAQEALKYKSAEEFVKAQIKTSQEFGFVGQKYIQTDLPIKDIHGRLTDYMEYRDITERGGFPSAGRKVTKPISVSVENLGDLQNTRVQIADGNQRLRQAIANGDETIPARIFTDKSQLTDVYNQAVKGVKEVVEEVPKAKGFKWTERGFITSVKEELPELKVAGQYVPKTNDRLMIKAANLIKDDLATAEKMALTGMDDNAVAVGAKLLDNYADEIAKTTNKATKNALVDKSSELANTMARNLTEQGRSVQAASLLGRLTPEGQLRFAAREIQKYNEGIEKAKGGLGGLKKKIPELTGEQANKIIDEMNAIKKMPDGTEKAIRFQKLQNYIQDLVPSTLMSKIVAVWKAGLLTGIKTSGLNIFSNISHFGSEIAKDIPAKVVDSVASLFTGKQTIGLTLRGTKVGIQEGFQKGIRYLKTGFDERNIGIKLDWKRVNFGKGKIAKGLQKYEETIFRIMGTEDQPFYYGAKARSLYDQAIAQASNKGLKGLEKQKLINNLVENPTEDMLKYAIKDAETVVYQQQTLLGKAARQIQKIPGGEFVVPFGRTPSAVATQIINYSPVGIIKTIIQNIGKGRFDQRLFAQGLGRGITGTAAMYIGYELGKKGLIALDRPTGEREQKLWELEGRKPNSIKIEGKWQSPIVLGPAGNLLLVGAHFQKAFQESGSPTEALSKGTLSSVKSFSEQTFLTGINQLTNALTDPDRFVESYPRSLLSSTIPTIVGDVAKTIDPKERRSEALLDGLKAKIPVLRETLEPRISVLGEEVERPGNIIETMIDPMRPQKAITTPLIAEFRRLTNVGFKVSPTLLGDKKGYGGLTPEQNTELWERVGEITESKLNNLIKLEQYLKEPDDKKAKLIESITNKSKLVARVEMVIKLTDGLAGDELKNKLSELKKSGLMTREVFNNYLKLR